jgi:hypothetical protein
MRLTVVVPTLNEAHGIGPTLDAVDRTALAALGFDVDFVVVDGESTDRTQDEAKARGARVIIEPRRGYGRAYKTGFAAADGDWIVTGDADGTYPFERIAEYLDEARARGLDFATCNRYAHLRSGAMSAKHRVGNWVLSTALRALFFARIRDSQSGMWIIRRDALARLPVAALSDGMAFSQEIKIEAFKRRDVRAAEFDGSLAPRVGDAKIESWGDGLGNLWRLVAHRFRRRRLAS